MEDSHQEFVQYTDDESLSDSEEHCPPAELTENSNIFPLPVLPHRKIKFFSILILLLVSSFLLAVNLPLYMSKVSNLRPGSPIYIIGLINTGIFNTIIFFTYCPKIYYEFSWKNIVLAVVYATTILIYLYSSAENRVLCHLQDPMKGLVLIFSLFQYFFFCRKVMGLYKIFYTTTIVIGLFIAMDFGLCDEYTCRGYDRVKPSDDAGTWTWKTHGIWAGLHMLGLLLFVGFFTLFDRYLHVQIRENFIVLPTESLNTISSSIGDTSVSDSQQLLQGEVETLSKTTICLRMGLSVHTTSAYLLAFICWIHTYTSQNYSEMKDDIISVFQCHFLNPWWCQGIVKNFIIFHATYIVFALTSISFLIMTQSVVFTIAVMAAALPFTTLWWSLFYASPEGFLIWDPKIRGEFFCSLIGLPIIIIGLTLWTKAHFEDIRKARIFRSSTEQENV